MGFKLKSNRILAIKLIFLTLTPPVIAAEVPGSVIGFSCNGCHGTDGRLVKPGMPKLKSQPADALEKSLLEFKYEQKSSSIMGRIAKGYTDAELKAVAQHFSSLE